MNKLYKQFLLLGYFGGFPELFQIKQTNRNTPPKTYSDITKLSLWHVALCDHPQDQLISSCLKRSHEQDRPQPLGAVF